LKRQSCEGTWISKRGKSLGHPVHSLNKNVEGGGGVIMLPGTYRIPGEQGSRKGLGGGWERNLIISPTQGNRKNREKKSGATYEARPYTGALSKRIPKR